MAETLYQDYDLISRKAAIDRIKAYCDGCDNYNGVRCRACQIADAMAAVDEVEFCRNCGAKMEGENGKRD